MSKTILALDVGEKRIGVAQGDTTIRIAVPYETIEVDGDEITAITQLLLDSRASRLVVGYPRNQSGEPTQQTAQVEQFVKKLSDIDLDVDIVYQDESLTSVIAEKRLIAQNKPYSRGDIDMYAASIILTDYLEQSR